LILLFLYFIFAYLYQFLKNNFHLLKLTTPQIAQPPNPPEGDYKILTSKINLKKNSFTPTTLSSPPPGGWGAEGYGAERYGICNDP
jgi:hypothetical protein